MVSLAPCVLVMEVNKKMVAYLTVVVLIVLWYGSSSMFSVYSKRVISVMDEQAGHETATFYTGNFFGSNAPEAEEWEFMPRSSCIVALLTALQSGCGLAVYAAFKGLLVASGRQPPQIEPLRELAWQCRWVGLLYFFGNLSTNLTLAFTKVTAAQCLKAAEPLFVVGAMRALAPEKFAEQINSSVLASLLLVVAGVGLSSFSPALSIAGLLTATCANTGFAVSSVLAKSIQKSSVSTLDIFGLSMAWGAAAGFLTVLVVGVVTRTLPASALGWDGLKSGIAYGLYNCFSFAILARVTNPTHAVLKVGKRVAALVVAGLLLGDDLEIRQWFGVGLAVLGAIFYQSGKSGSKQSPLKGACAAMAVVTVGLSISCFNNVDIIDANSTRIFIGANIMSCNMSREKHNAIHAQGAGEWEFMPKSSCICDFIPNLEQEASRIDVSECKVACSARSGCQSFTFSDGKCYFHDDDDDACETCKHNNRDCYRKSAARLRQMHEMRLNQGAWLRASARSKSAMVKMTLAALEEQGVSRSGASVATASIFVATTIDGEPRYDAFPHPLVPISMIKTCINADLYRANPSDKIVNKELAQKWTARNSSVHIAGTFSDLAEFSESEFTVFRTDADELASLMLLAKSVLCRSLPIIESESLEALARLMGLGFYRRSEGAWKLCGSSSRSRVFARPDLPAEEDFCISTSALLYDTGVADFNFDTAMKLFSLDSWNAGEMAGRVSAVRGTMRDVAVSGGGKTSNGGDLAGIFVAKHLLPESYEVNMVGTNVKGALALVGSIIHQTARIPGMIVWGPGIIMPTPVGRIYARVLAVRGPRSRDRLLLQHNVNPLVISDPALLAANAFPIAVLAAKYNVSVARRGVCFVIHGVDRAIFKGLCSECIRDHLVNNYNRDVEKIFAALIGCKRVVTSSLHGMIFAHAYSIPAVVIQLGDKITGGDFKYADYLHSVGVTSFRRRKRVLGDSGDLLLKGLDEWASLVDEAEQPTFPIPKIHFYETFPIS